jgi:hypothetical protein
VRMRVRRKKRMSLHRGRHRCPQGQDSVGAWISCTTNWSMDKRSGF